MPTRDPAWPNHKVHPEERWGRVFLRSDRADYGEEETKAGVRFSLEGGEGDHGRSDRQTDSLADSAGYTFLVLTIPSC